jgi:hypothetical protein
MLFRIVLVFLVLCLGLNPALAKRVALVVGNSNYQNTTVLANPTNDAKLMEKALREAGFEVTLVLDADQPKLKRAMLEFGRKLRKGVDASLFYYAGHGVQVNGENYLVPVDASLDNEDEVNLQTIPVNAFLQTMESAKSPVNIVVLDACRNNPFSRAFRGTSGGLAPVNAPRGSYIAYATAPGAVAADGDDGNSPYTEALASVISLPGLKLEDVFKKTREKVLASTDEKQVPWETSSITGDFYFTLSPDKASISLKKPETKEAVALKKEQGTSETPPEQGDFAPEKVIQINCRMDACGWIAVRESDQKIVNPSNRVLRVKYSNGVSEHKLSVAEGDGLEKAYPDRFTKNVQVVWESDELEILLLCSKSLPAVAHVSGEKLDVLILDLAGGDIFGYQVSDAAMYSKLCLDADYFNTSSKQFRSKYGIQPVLKFDENSEQELAKKAEKVIRQHGKNFLK